MYTDFEIWRLPRSAHNARVDGLGSALDLSLDEQGHIVSADSFRDGNERKRESSFLLASPLRSVGCTRNQNMTGVVAEAIVFSCH